MRLTKIPIFKYAYVSVGLFKGRGQLLDQSYDCSCCTLLHSDGPNYLIIVPNLWQRLSHVHAHDAHGHRIYAHNWLPKSLDHDY